MSDSLSLSAVQFCVIRYILEACINIQLHVDQRYVYYTTYRKVASSSPDEVNGFYQFT
jgi:hypothetical protein